MRTVFSVLLNYQVEREGYLQELLVLCSGKTGISRQGGNA